MKGRELIRVKQEGRRGTNRRKAGKARKPAKGIGRREREGGNEG